MATVLTEGVHPIEFLLSEGQGTRSRDAIVIASGSGVVKAGTVLGKITASGKYTRYPMTRQWPVYITYFTMGTDVEGTMRSFADIYGRDAPVLAALDAPRQSTRARKTSEEAVEIIDDMQT